MFPFAKWRERTLLNSVTPSIFRKNLISDACTCDRILSVITQNSRAWVRMGTKTALKIEINQSIIYLHCQKSVRWKLVRDILNINNSWQEGGNELTFRFPSLQPPSWIEEK